MLEYSAFKADYKRFQELDAEVLGVSVDHIFAHKVFAASLGGLPFPLVADWSKQMARAYGVLNEERGVAQRSVFVVDKQGILRYKNAQYDVRNAQHYQELLEAVASIQRG